MRIKTFSPELAGIEDKHDLEKKMIHSDVISHADVKAYADYIIGQLKALKNSSEEEKESFVVDAFNEDNIEGKVWNERAVGNLLLVEPEEALSAIKRIRRALVEELKGKVDEKIYFVISDLIGDGSRMPVTGDTGRKNIIHHVVDIENEKEGVFKDQEPIIDVQKENLSKAMVLFKQLAPHPNIAKVKLYDPETNRTVYEKLDFVPLYEYLKSENFDEKKLLASLKVLRDCIKGAIYLADNHLILQDICLANLGVENDGKGILFDLEGLTVAGTVFPNRMSHGEIYFPPELIKIKEGTIPPELEPSEIKPSEMVFQFGECLHTIQDTYSNSEARARGQNLDILRSLRALFSDMTVLLDSVSGFEEDVFGARISLQEAEVRLDEIIDKIESAKILNNTR